MSGFLVRPASRRRSRFAGRLCLLALAGLASVACSGAGAAGEGQNLVGVETSAFSVAVENRVGMPLIDVEVTIVPLGAPARFTKFAGRLENAEKRALELSGFMDRGGTPFSLRLVRPQKVRVTGKDLNNKAIEVEVPWK